MRDASQFLINQDTKTPLADVLKISRVLDALDNIEDELFDEKYMLGIFYRFIEEEEPCLLEEDASSEFIKWFNDKIIDGFIQQMTDDEFQGLEKVWQEKK